MALFSLRRYAWNFPSNNHGQIFGIADSGVETFNGTPIKSLAREICQNSIDANLKNGEPTRIVFRTFEIAPSEIPGFDDLEDAFSKSLEYWSKQKSTKAKSFFQSALKLAKQPKITCLRISDTNTTGLLGSDEEYNTAVFTSSVLSVASEMCLPQAIFPNPRIPCSVYWATASVICMKSS